MNAKILDILQNVIQQNQELAVLVQRPTVMMKLQDVAENLADQKTILAKYANDEEILPFIDVLKPILDEQISKQDEEEIPDDPQDEQEEQDEEDKKKISNIELLISGYIRIQCDQLFEDNQDTVFPIDDLSKICMTMYYYNSKKLLKLCGSKFVKKDINNIDGELIEATFENDVLGNDLILIYFSAAWCPPSKVYTKKLAAFYKESIEAGYKIQIIFISRDNNKEQFEQYYREYHGTYIAIPPSDPEGQNEFVYKYFNVEAIPHLVVVNDEARIIDIDGRWTVINNKVKSNEKWLERSRRLKSKKLV